MATLTSPPDLAQLSDRDQRITPSATAEVAIVKARCQRTVAVPATTNPTIPALAQST